MTRRPALFLTSSLLVGLLLSAAGSPESKSDGSWPHWRGPARDGVSTEKDWSAEGREDPLWSVDVGMGYSAVSIANGRLYTMGFDNEQKNDMIWCLDAKTGEELWSYRYPAKLMANGHAGGTLSTPSLDGGDLYSLNREGKLFCFDAANGDVRWKLDIIEETGAKPGIYGFACSPLILGEDLILNLGMIVCLDKRTHEVKWDTKSYGEAYSTPAAFELKGKPRLAVFNGEGLAILSGDDGEEQSFYEWNNRFRVNAATPIVDGDTVFISCTAGVGGVMLRLDGKELEVLWKVKEMRNKMAGCVLVDGHYYGFDESVVKCMDQEGKILWSQRGLGQGALSATLERLIIATSDGELVIAEVSPAGYKELSRKKVIEGGGVFWTTPVIVDGLIYVRASRGELVCLDHR